MIMIDCIYKHSFPTNLNSIIVSNRNIWNFNQMSQYTCTAQEKMGGDDVSPK